MSEAVQVWRYDCVACDVQKDDFSSVFAMGESSAMGLYNVPRVVSLPGLGIGIILAIFHACGIVFVLRG